MRFPVLILVSMLAGLAVSGPVQSRDRDFLRGADLRPDSLMDRRGREEKTSRMTAAQAAREAQQRYGGGKVLSVDSASDGYHVKLLRNGDVRVVFISDR